MARIGRGKGKTALLEAVVRVTASQGLRGVTYRTVAAEAGVSYGLVTYHFGSRDSMIEQALAMTIEQGVRVTPVVGDAEGSLGVGSDLLEVSRRRRQDQLFQYEIALEATRKPELQPMVDLIYSHYQAGVVTQLREVGIDDPRLHTLVFSALEGMTLYHAVNDDDERLAQELTTLRAVVDLVARAVADGDLPGLEATTARDAP